MTSLRPNLVKRIQRLPKPINVAGAMQPLFEAVSNAIHSTQGKFGDQVSTSGRIFVTVNTNRKKEDLWATVEDNGKGLDNDNWEALATSTCVNGTPGAKEPKVSGASSETERSFSRMRFGDWRRCE